MRLAESSGGTAETATVLRAALKNGSLIDIGGCRLYAHSQGTGTPAVILESGIAATSLSWSYVQPMVAKFTRVLSYDRAGLGASSACRNPRTLEQFSSELNALLTRADIAPPYILAGHSFGGLLVRAFAALHPKATAGIVMVDPVSLQHWANASADELKRLAYGVRLSRRGAVLARLGVVRLALWLAAAGGRKLPKLIARASAGKGTPAIDRLMGEVRKLPPDVYPMLRSHWSRSKTFLAMADHLECLPASARSVLCMPIPPDIPVAILSASSALPAELEEREGWVKQREYGRHIRLENCGHWLHLELPGVVAAAIKDLVDLARQRVPSRQLQ